MVMAGRPVRGEDLNQRHRKGSSCQVMYLGFRNRKGRIMRRIFALVALVLATGGMLGFTAAAASADGHGAQTFTQTFKDATDAFVDFVPCRDFQATITITYNGVMHYTVNKAGRFLGDGNDDRHRYGRAS